MHACIREHAQPCMGSPTSNNCRPRCCWQWPASTRSISVLLLGSQSRAGIGAAALGRHSSAARDACLNPARRIVLENPRQQALSKGTCCCCTCLGSKYHQCNQPLGCLHVAVPSSMHKVNAASRSLIKHRPTASQRCFVSAIAASFRCTATNSRSWLTSLMARAIDITMCSSTIRSQNSR